MRVQAAVLREISRPFIVEDLTVGPPSTGEVLVKLSGVGVCHTDLVVRDGGIPVSLPAVLGHEGSGVVVQVGPGVVSVEVGDHVVLSVDSCGACAQCRSGHASYCEEAIARNLSMARLDGTTAFSNDSEPVGSHFFGQSSFSSYTIAAERSVVRVPRDLPLELLGPFGCGLQTGAGAVLNVFSPPAGSSIAVFGVGGVGCAAVMAARAVGCTTIIAVDKLTTRLDVASKIGATHVLDASSVDVSAAIADLTGGHGVNYALETTGVPGVLRQAVDALAVRGTAGLVGVQPPGAETSLDTVGGLGKGWNLSMIIEGDSVPQELIPRLLDLHKAGQFPFERLVTTYPFVDIERAVADAESGAAIKPVLLF